MKHVLTTLFLCWNFCLFAQNDLETTKTSDAPKKLVEQVPIYPGCENEVSNADRRQCLSDKISELFISKFNSILHPDSELSPGAYRINVVFKINSEGQIVGIRARGTDSYLEQEAVRVTKMIPKLQPGTLNGVAVAVPYSLPIYVKMKKSHL